jgi:riboflavin kinase, archaea type
MTESQILLKGEVVSGRGEGRYFTCLDWVREQVVASFGFEPIAGTFNVKVVAEQKPLLETLKRTIGIEIVPPNQSFCLALSFPVRVGAVRGAAVIPLVEDYPQDILEIIAAVNVRDALRLKDNDPVEVRVVVPDGGNPIGSP